MNLDNERLVAIQRKKTIYRRCLEDCKTVSESKKYREAIKILSEEENKILERFDLY